MCECHANGCCYCLWIIGCVGVGAYMAYSCGMLIGLGWGLLVLAVMEPAPRKPWRNAK